MKFRNPRLSEPPPLEVRRGSSSHIFAPLSEFCCGKAAKRTKWFGCHGLLFHMSVGEQLV